MVDLPFIDCHTHIGRLPGVIGDTYTAEDLCHIAAHEGASYMLASSASVSLVSQTYGMAETTEMARRYSDRLGSMLWINPQDPSWTDCVKVAEQHAFRGIKIHPVLDHYNIERGPLDEVFQCAQQHHWPVLTHTGDDGTPISALRYEPLVQAYPDVALILAHLRAEAIPLAKRYRNVYVDTTHVAPALVEIAVDALGPDRILFGTDAPAGFDVGHPVTRARPHRDYRTIIQALRERQIAPSDLERILYHNARALFALP